MHVMQYTGEKLHKCDYCDNLFASSYHLKKHVRIHTNDGKYSCAYCDKQFSSSGLLSVHVRRHTGEKPCQCSFCSKCFVNGRELTQHVRVHMHEKPYECSLFADFQWQESRTSTMNIILERSHFSVINAVDALLPKNTSRSTRKHI